MQQTMLIIVGVLIGALFLGLAYSMINDKVSQADKAGSFLDVQHKVEAGKLMVSWEADRQSDGTLRYVRDGLEQQQTDHSISQIHRIEVMAENVTAFYIVACEANGECFESQRYELS